MSCRKCNDRGYSLPDKGRPWLVESCGNCGVGHEHRIAELKIQRDLLRRELDIVNQELEAVKDGREGLRT